MVLVDDQNMIEILFTHRTNPALCKRVSFESLKGGVNNLDSFREKPCQIGMRIWYRGRGSESEMIGVYYPNSISIGELVE